MSDLDLVPPPMPGERQQQRSGGFLKRFFFKEEAPQQPAPAMRSPTPPARSDDVDFDEIKRKLGLDDASPSTQRSPLDDADALFTPPRMAADDERDPPLPTSDEAMRAGALLDSLPADIAPLSPAMPEPPAPQPQQKAAPEKPAPVKKEKEPVLTAKQRRAAASAQKAAQDIAPARAPSQQSDWASDAAAPSAGMPSSTWSGDVAPMPRMPAQPASAMNAWAQDVPASPLPATPAFAGDIAGGEHHDAVERQLEPIEKAQQAIAKEIEAATPPPLPELSDWHMQEKEVPPDKYFILRNGHRVRSLRELLAAMEFIDDATFSHHVNQYRNDFANWVHGVIGDPALAERVRRADDKEEVAAILRKERTQAEQSLASDMRKQEQGVKKLSDLSGKLDDLKRRLDQKTKELADEKAKGAQRLKAALDQELKRRLDIERGKLDAQRGKLAEQQAQAQLLTSQAQDRAKAAQEREQAIAKREEDLAKRAAQLAQERQEAAPVLKDAQKVRADLESIRKYQSQVQESLKDIAKREAAIARQDETLRQRERKATQDLTRIAEETARLDALKAEHAAREEKVAALERQARATAAESAKRKAEAVAQEKKSAEALKAQTRQLEELRKRVDDALKKVIKNKEKAMYAKQLREHLEQAIRLTKEDVAAERKQLEQAGFGSYMQAKEDATPIGQPASRVEDDVLRVRDLDAYRKVEQARAALERKDVASARRLYNELREDFAKQKLEAPEKNALYMSIRELYDDIHLAMLEQ